MMSRIHSLLFAKKEAILDMNTLRTTRRQLGLTQAEVAAAAKISLPTLRALERGGGGVRALVAVMAVLDLRWGWAPDRVQAVRALADRRQARGLSQAQLANRIGVSRPTIIALERDLGATVTTLVKAATVLGVRPVLRAIPVGRGGLVPATNAPAQDLVMTPPELAERVIAHFADRMTGRILDPARGQGAFYNRFPAHFDRHWCEIAEGRDFLDWHQPVDWVMTNPPWSRLRDFSRHARRRREALIEQIAAQADRLAAALPGALRVAETDVETGIDPELGVLCHPGALVPGQGSAQQRW